MDPGHVADAPGLGFLAARRVTRLMLVVLLMGACVSLPSCGQRDRSNPLDPLNKSTGGSPPGFEAVALDRRVDLRWSALDLDGLTGYRIYRRQGGTGQLELRGTYASSLGSAIDSLLSNGTTYYYKLVPLIEGYGEGTSSPLLPATPGAYFAVAVDAFSGTVTRFSADFRATMWTEGGLYYPLAVASEGRKVWVTDLYAGTICLSENGKLLWNLTDFNLPMAISVRPDGTAAVADYGKGTVTVLSPQGQVEAVISEALSAPASVSFGMNGEIWVADLRGARVNKYSVDGSLLGSFTRCVEPRLLDAATLDGSCWVADVGAKEVIELSSQLEELQRVGFFSKPSAVTADPVGGGCWVSDWQTEEIARISELGEIAFRTGRVGRVVSIRVLPDDGRVWLADAKNARLLVLSPTGRIISVATLPFSPASLAVVGEY